ncbi:MAG TPA: type IV toxin-antitoxin system AbiEi family antitoxin domain-containing protein [bacterium]|nr:type IV toxin-antitoxin system AbiEi family antitoxin domain-containing protein [bacterium]
MKSRVGFAETIKKIQTFAPQLNGVFSFADLWVLLGLKTSDRTAKAVARLIREKVLFKIRRNIYATDKPDLWTLASRLKENAYVSMDSVLAKNGLIGTVPTYSVSLVYPGPPETIKTPFGLLRFFKIKKDLLFGFQREAQGIRIADSEKAYLDILYYRSKGATFVVDPISDIDTQKLDLKKLRKYLRAYKNPKFVAFVKGQIREEA